jgi:hypothetical protein
MKIENMMKTMNMFTPVSSIHKIKSRNARPVQSAE